VPESFNVVRSRHLLSMAIEFIVPCSCEVCTTKLLLSRPMAAAVGSDDSPHNIAIVALANKLARMAWAVLTAAI